MYLIHDDYTNEVWNSFENLLEAETYLQFGLVQEGQNPRDFSIIKIN